MGAPVVLRAAARELRPWKNGGGRTSEVAAFPVGSGMDDFGWRISIADVDADGPFSVFPLVERHILILAGSLRLRFADRDRVISAGDAPFTFSGCSPIIGTLVDGSVRDLNLMVRTDQYKGKLRIVGSGSFQATSLSTVLVSQRTATANVPARPAIERRSVLNVEVSAPRAINTIEASTVRFGPGQASGRHLHHHPVVGLVTEGTFVLEV